MDAQPFLKWAGGKRQLLPELLKYVPAGFNTYVEPFVGGGALFFRLQPKKAVLADLNEYLIDTYTVVRDHVSELLRELRGYVNEADYYYEVRAREPGKLDPIRRAAREIYLNKTCFNGLYRVNKGGQFNVPFGGRKNPAICDEPKLLAAHKALQGVHLTAGDYKEVLRRHARPGDFIFLDPPYHPAGGYADFKRFTKEFFYEEDHIELRDEVCRLVEKGCLVLLTNSNTEFIRKLYEGFDYAVLDTRRVISSNPSTRTGQDLIVTATKPAQTTIRGFDSRRHNFLKSFPGTRFMGSKYRLLPFLSSVVEGLRYRSVLDAFSGSACVSYMFKQKDVQVVSNDFMHFAHRLAEASVENSTTRLSRSDVEFLMSPNPGSGNFISSTFRGLFFTDEENNFLDSLRANIELLDNVHKRSLALAAICRACLKRRPRGVFTYVGNRYDDGRRDLKMDLQSHFLANVQAFNVAVFDTGQECVALKSDVFALDVEADLVYLDPPYYTPHSDNDYTRRYHFIEGLVRQWKGLEIQHNTKTKKFKRYDTPFTNKDTVHEAFDRLFAKFKDSLLVVSYSSNSIPNKGELVEMLKKYKRQVSVHQVNHTYSFGTHGHLLGNGTSRVREFLFVAS